MTQDVIDVRAGQGSGWTNSGGIWWSTWDASSSQQEACSECGAQCKRGWNAPNGQRYCWSCWDQWHAMPHPLPAASNFDRGGRRTWRKALPLKRAFSIRDGCPCCTPGAVPLEVQKVYQQPQLDSKDLFELSDLSYCDAHCHLDILLHNRLNGGTQWGTKEKICKNWLAGQCWYYKDCHFAHGEQELEPRRMLAPEHVEPYLSELQRRAARRSEPMLRSLITTAVNWKSLKTQSLSSTSQRSWVSTRCTARLDAIRMTTETSRMKPKSGCVQKSKRVAEEWWRWASADWTIGRTTTSL